MSLRERSHASYLGTPEAKSDVREQQHLAENDNDKPKTAFERAIDAIQAEYKEVDTVYREATKHLEVLTNDLALLWKEIEEVGIQTRASAPLMGEYAAIAAEQQALIDTKTEVEQKMDRLRLELEPFWALQEATTSIQSASGEMQQLQAEQQTLQAEAVKLREEWAAQEVDAAEEQMRIDREDEFLAATQRELFENIKAVNTQYQEHKRNPHAAYDLRYIAYFDQVEKWLEVKGQERTDLTTKREALQAQRHVQKAKGKAILARYDACMERQMAVIDEFGEAERRVAQANAAHQYGVRGVGESLQARQILSSEEPAWIGTNQRSQESNGSDEPLQEAA